MNQTMRRVLQRAIARMDEARERAGRIVTGDPLARRFATFGVNSCVEYPRAHLGNPAAIAIGDDVYVMASVCLEALAPPGSPVIRLGNRTMLGRSVRIVAVNGVLVGDDCAIGHGTTIADTIHDWKDAPAGEPTWKAPLKVGRPLTIEEGVWIGNGCVITGGITIGARSIVGPNSVVSRDVPPDTIVVGNPAKVQRTRDASGDWRWLVDPDELDLVRAVEQRRGA